MPAVPSAPHSESRPGPSMGTSSTRCCCPVAGTVLMSVIIADTPCACASCHGAEVEQRWLCFSCIGTRPRETRCVCHLVLVQPHDEAGVSPRGAHSLCPTRPAQHGSCFWCVPGSECGGQPQISWRCKVMIPGDRVFLEHSQPKANSRNSHKVLRDFLENFFLRISMTPNLSPEYLSRTRNNK